MSNETDLPPGMENDTPAATATVQQSFACPDAFQGISELILSEDEKRRLAEAVGDSELDILPSGEVYPGQMVIRTKLNEIFGPGQWALMPRGPAIACDGTLTREYALFVRGHYIGEATGEKVIDENNKRQNYGNACESVKSAALKRCCKDLGLASQCWNKRDMEQWKRTYAVQVDVRQRDGNYKKMWRRVDADPFPYERQGSANNPSLNPQSKSEAQAQAQAAAPAQAAPQAQQPAPSGGDVITGLMEREVYSKPTGKGGTRYAIKVGGNWYATFSKSISDVASEAWARKAPVSIRFHVGQFGNDIDTLEIAQTAAPTAGNNEMPF